MRGRVVGAGGDTGRHGTTSTLDGKASPAPRVLPVREMSALLGAPPGTAGQCRRCDPGDATPAACRLPPAEAGRPGPRPVRPVTLYLTPPGAGVGLVLAAAAAAIMRAVCGAIPQRFVGRRDRCAAGCSAVVFTGQRREIRKAIISNQQGLSDNNNLGFALLPDLQVARCYSTACMINDLVPS